MWHWGHIICGLFRSESPSCPELGLLQSPVKRSIHSIPVALDPPTPSQDIETVLICHEWRQTDKHYLALQRLEKQDAL